jgi:putative hemolysin
MRHLRTTIGLLALAAALTIVTAPAQAATMQPKGSPVIIVSSEGGFVAPGYIKSALPALVGYANGAVLTQSQAMPRPDLRAMRLHAISATHLRALVNAVARAAVTPTGGWGTPGVADVPNTRVRIAYPGLRRDISVYALSFTDGGNVTPAQASARRKLAKAIADLDKAVRTAVGRTWAPATYEAWTMTPLVKISGAGMPNPASVFCESMGGTLAIVDTPSGQIGQCTLPDGTVTEEWAYFRGTAPSFAHWPESVAAPTKACSTVRSAAFRSEFKGDNESGRWVLPSGQAPVFVFRPVLPGEHACKRA